MSIIILTPKSDGHIQVFKGADHYMRLRVSDRPLTKDGVNRKLQSSVNEEREVFINFDTKQDWDDFLTAINNIEKL